MHGSTSPRICRLWRWRALILSPIHTLSFAKAPSRTFYYRSQPLSTLHTEPFFFFECVSLKVKTLRGAMSQVCCPRLVFCADQNSPAYTVDGELRKISTTPTSPPQGESVLCDSSGPLFSMYSKIAEEEDDKMAERWQKDAEGIIIFVCHRVAFHTAANSFKSQLDRFVLCGRRCVCGCFSPGPQTQLAGYFRVLSREYLPAPCRSQPTPPDQLFHSGKAFGILSANICHLGEHPLVLELGYQSYMCDTGNILTTVDTSTHKNYSTSTALSAQTGTGACILCEWHRQISCSLGGRSIASLVHLSLFTFFTSLLVYVFNINHTVLVRLYAGSHFCQRLTHASR